MMNNTTEIDVLEATIRNAKAKIKALKQKSITIGSIVTLKPFADDVSEILGKNGDRRYLETEYYHECGRDSGSAKKIPYTVLSVEGGKFKITGKDNCGKKIVAIVPKEYVVFVKNA